MAYNLIDVSEWQGTIDWKAVRDAGYHAIIRCGYGSDYANQDDEQFLRNITACEMYGIPHGVYLYSYAQTVEMAQSEAAHVLRLLNGVKLQYPVYLDLEEQGCWEEAAIVANAFGDAIEAAGYWCGIYANLNWWKNSPLNGVERFTKWVAQWNNTGCDMDCDIWQYTSDGTVPGVPGRVDCNIVYRDLPAEIAGYEGGSTQAPIVDELAQAVIRGEYGNGDDRKAALGARYDEVQARVNELLGAASAFDVEAAARAVIRGEYGNGDARKTALGSHYDEVQARVNELLGQGSGGAVYYTVKNGDCLSVIAQTYGVSTNQLVNWNGIENPSLIYPGEVLRVR